MSYIGTEPKDIRSFGRTKFDYTATQGQTAFTGADDDGKVLAFTVGQIEVYVNGILMDDSDFTTTGTGTVTLASAANLNDVVNVVSFETNIPDSNYVPASGGTFTGNITASGTLGVTGAVTASNGLTVDDDGATVLTVDRATSNGDVIDIQKDGTSVGTIGANGSNLYIGSPEGTDAYIGFGNNIVRPVTSAGASRDNAIDLGYTGMRFKDLYLSGGAYIGGTTSANHLDDYETGSFQMTMTGINTTSAVGYGIYVKVGNLCHFSWYSGTQTVTSAVVPVLGGLPFTSISPYGSGGAYAAVTFAHNTYASNVASGYINIGTTSIYLTANNSSGGASVTTGSKYVMCSGTYYVA